MRRALGLPLLSALLLAACAPNPGSAPPQTDPGASMPAVSPGASAEDEVAQRESIDDVLADPAAYVDADITIMENIDQVYVPDSAFVFSGTEVQGQLLVVLSTGATVDKPIAADRVVSATGRVIPFTAERMAAAGLELTPDDERLSGFSGNAVLVVSHIGDPLAR